MAENDQAPEKQLAIQKVYVKDFSFESPNAPDVFQRKDWSPKTDLNLRSEHTAVADNTYEVILAITIDAKDDDKTVFLVELQQAALFHISGYDEEELRAIIGSFCPNILFPYAREAVASMISRGGFPEFVLQPINFDALYAQARAEGAAKEGNGSSSETH